MQVELYTRRGCHLCEDARRVLLAVRARVPFELHEVDVDRDPALRALYGLEVPVVLIEGRPAFVHRVDAAALERALGGGAAGG